MPRKLVLTDRCIDAIMKARGAGKSRKRWGEVAKELHISDDHLYHLLSRRRGVSADTALRIATYTKLPQKDVFCCPL